MKCKFHLRGGTVHSQKYNIILWVYVNDLQLLVVVQSLQNIVLREASVAVPLRMHLLKLRDYLYLVQLLHLHPLEHVSDVVDDRRHLVRVAVVVVLF